MIINGVSVYALRNSESLIILQYISYTRNPTEPKYNMGGRYLIEYINFSNFSIKLLIFYLNKTKNTAAKNVTITR